MKKMIMLRRKVMKMNIKKTISMTLALVLTVAMAAGCSKTDDPAQEDYSGDTVWESLIDDEDDAPIFSSDITRAELAATAAVKWNETQISETMYTTQACYSRAVPAAGADVVSKYKKGAKVTVVPATDTGYYKLKDGSFIHSSFLSEDKPGTKATTTAAADDDEIFDDDVTTKKPSSTTKKGSTTTKKGSTTTKKTPPSTVTTVTYNRDYKDKYVYKQLPSAEKQLYANIVEAAKSFSPKVAVPSELSNNQVIKTYVNVTNQEPQLFWLPRAIPTPVGGTMTINYVYSKSRAQEIQTELDKNVKTIMNSVNQYKSTISKIKVIYDWVVKNNNFSKSDSADTCSVKNGLTKGGDLQCAGYAKTMQYLFDIAGIESVAIVGTNPENLSHAWNIVYCDNGYYNIDATWGDPINKHGEDYIRYSFFLVPDAWIVNDHLTPNVFFKSNGYPIKLFEQPVCTKTAANYYKVYKKTFDNYDDAMAGVKAEIDSAIKAGRNCVEIRVTSKKLWDQLNTNDSFRTFQNYAKSKSKKVDYLSRVKNLNDGVLVIQYDIFYK